MRERAPGCGRRSRRANARRRVAASRANRRDGRRSLFRHDRPKPEPDNFFPNCRIRAILSFGPPRRPPLEAKAVDAARNWREGAFVKCRRHEPLKLLGLVSRKSLTMLDKTRRRWTKARENSTPRDERLDGSRPARRWARGRGIGRGLRRTAQFMTLKRLILLAHETELAPAPVPVGAIRFSRPCSVMTAVEVRQQSRESKGRHCERSEAIQTWGLRRRLRLDRVAVARDDE